MGHSVPTVLPLFLAAILCSSCARVRQVDLKTPGGSLSLQLDPPVRSQLQEAKAAYHKLDGFCHQQILLSDHCSQLEVWWNDFIQALSKTLLPTDRPKPETPTKPITPRGDQLNSVIAARNVYFLQVRRLLEHAPLEIIATAENPLTKQGNPVQNYYANFIRRNHFGTFIYSPSSPDEPTTPVVIRITEDGWPKLVVYQVDANDTIFSIGYEVVNLFKFIEAASRRVPRYKNDPSNTVLFTLQSSTLVHAITLESEQ